MPAPLFDNLGTYHFPITTANPTAQRYFDQGMVLFYGFEWGESARSFRGAVASDPNCAMCYWGLAIALTYKSNEPMTGEEQDDASDAIHKASMLATKVSPKEQAYIQALTFRYKSLQKKPKICLPGCGSHHTSNAASKIDMKNYFAALAKVVQQYPDDHEAKVVYATAIFWDMIDHDNQEKPTARMIQLLKPVLAKEPNHIGANHYYIHAVEPTAHPGNATKSADILRTLVPGSQHLVHMPGHIYFLTGRYHEATEANIRAIDAYQNYRKQTKAQGFKPQLTYLYYHDFDFLRSAAVMEGRQALALFAMNQMMNELPATLVAQNEDLQIFLPIPYFVKARFGLWQELLKTPMPNPKYIYALGMWHYAMGMANVNLGNVPQAEKDRAALQQIIAKQGNNIDKMPKSLLTIASNVLNAALENAAGNELMAINYLKKADQLQMGMSYHEPPDWYFPMKEAIGDLYLKANKPKEAIAMYQGALKKYPNNPWALYGLMQSYEKLGQHEKAAKVNEEFKNAWQHADIPKPVPLFK